MSHEGDKGCLAILGLMLLLKDKRPTSTNINTEVANAHSVCNEPLENHISCLNSTPTAQVDRTVEASLVTMELHPEVTEQELNLQEKEFVVI